MTEDSVASVIYTYDPNYQRFADYMGIDAYKRRNFETAKKLALLYDWAKNKSGSDKFNKIAEEIDGLRKTSGVSFSGETLVSFLYQRVRVDMDSQRLKKPPEPTKREKYESALKGASDKIEESNKQIEKAEKEDRVAKSQNTRYINKYQNAIPKRKKGRIPSYDYSDTSSEELPV